VVACAHMADSRMTETVNTAGSARQYAAEEDSGTNTDAAAAPAGIMARLGTWARRVDLERALAIGFLVGGIASGTVTFVAMTGNIPVVSGPGPLLLLLNLDLVLLLGLGVLIARRLVILWAERKRGLAGAQLHTRLVALFSLIAVAPTIVVAIFTVLLFDFGLQGWFSDRVRTAVESSFAVAQAYLEEHRRTIGADALAVAQDVSQMGVSLALNPDRFSSVLANQVGERSLTEALVFDRSGRVIGRAGYSLLVDFNPEIPDWALRRADQGEIVIMTAETEDRVRALLRLPGFTDTYLYVGRLVDPQVLAHIEQTQNAAKLYEDLEGKRSNLQITFALIFAVIALLLLLAAVWVGLAFANHLARPIGQLIEAAQRVGAGDLRVRVEDFGEAAEVGTLARAFNGMTNELASQRHELLETNRELDNRTRFIEAVLGGVSAGIIGMDRSGTITLVNLSACTLLSCESDALVGHRLDRALPEMADLLEEVRRRPRRLAERTVKLSRGEREESHFLVRIAAEVDDAEIIGYVVTFDDVTELLSAQRKAAWADVARRIAHEIKNPLTPIQLSAERLKRKYMDEIRSDPATFKTCTDIIVRQVGDIGRMVDEFSSFARMPAPSIVEEDLSEILRQVLFLQKGAHPDITFTVETPNEPLIVPCDREQLGRALTNLLQNACDAIDRRPRQAGGELPPGVVAIRVLQEARGLVLEISDNGVGLPVRERHRLTEPYVTTREEGTGLGLAIVKKIMEDHGGDLRLSDRPGGGAVVAILIPRQVPQGGLDTPCEPNREAKAGTHGT